MKTFDFELLQELDHMLYIFYKYVYMHFRKTQGEFLYRPELPLLERFLNLYGKELRIYMQVSSDINIYLKKNLVK